MRILIVEDSSPLRDSLKKGLGQEGFAVDTAADGLTGLDLARNNPFDVLILDLMLPGLDGLQLLAQLREKLQRPKVLILTARDRVEDRVLGLNSGADDYLVKPFAFDELLARVHVLVRRHYREHGKSLQIGQLNLDLISHSASYRESSLELTTREFSLLEYLALRRGQTVTREEIEDHIYGVHDLPSSNAVDSIICLLRGKIGKDGKHLIRTRRKLGYVLEELAP